MGAGVKHTSEGRKRRPGRHRADPALEDWPLTGSSGNHPGEEPTLLPQFLAMPPSSQDPRENDAVMGGGAGSLPETVVGRSLESQLRAQLSQGTPLWAW